jgi:hypothetical protein
MTSLGSTLHPFIEHKQHRHHNQRHMMMPTASFLNLVVGHTALTFGIFKYSFHLMTLKLLPGQSFPSGSFRSIAKKNFGLRTISQYWSNNKIKAMTLAGVAIPHKNRKTN